ncbi:hypothetical protein HMPREF2988_02395 [Enterococcus sp. HMSC061C05]|nr:hypothetical protein HMPREF2988_02395 [Enterococcus sp. HMSC061C05]
MIIQKKRQKGLWQNSYHNPFFRINGVFLPTPQSQVTIFNKHEKLFIEIVPCDSELNGRLTTSI